MKKVEYVISDMECAMCVLHLEGLQDSIAGIHHIEANLRRQKLVVEYDDQQVIETKIKEAILKKGYTIQG